MKILIVNTFDIAGGAARAAYRLHQALLNSGVDSQMLVMSKISDDDTVIESGIKIKKIQKVMSIIRHRLDALPLKYYKNKTETLFSPAWIPFSAITDAIEAIDPDVVHLHWICGGMIRIEDLSKIKKPIIWSLHDMWAFTGGCHYDGGCGKYKTGCGFCPVLHSKKINDLSKVVFLRKEKTYAKMENFTVVGLSRWLADCADNSALFARERVVNLPNPIDVTRYKPINKSQARIELNLPIDKKLILFGAESATSDPRKGYMVLVKALDIIPKKSDKELIVFGSSQPDNSLQCGFTSHYLGQIEDKLLPLLYSASDVMVVPSVQENLSNTIMESLACGTPVVGFDIGGNRDLIDHKCNGYLAEPFSPSDLSNGILFILNSPEYTKISDNAREKVIRCFDSKTVAGDYIDLYKSVL